MTLCTRLLAASLFVAIISDLTLANPAFSKQNEQCTSDKYRPRYHFSPAANWINDPNGMIYYDGLYHLFYQYHPYSMQWGPMHWGHAVSKNLVTWTELDIALEPDDIGDVFSGSAVVDTLNTTGFKTNDSDPIVAIYTSAAGNNYETQRQSLAYSLDKGMTFKKFEKNPVLESTSKDFRDPKVFFHDGRWIMSLAAGNKIEFYSSPNLKDWKKESEFGTSEGEHGSATQYFIGDFSKNDSNPIAYKTNTWKKSQWLDWGPDNYAGVTFSNEPGGRFIYVGWMNNWLYANFTPTSTWRGQMTIPRQLSLRVLNHEEKQYRLVSTPIKELETLRNHLQYIEQNQEIDLGKASTVNLTEKADFATPSMEVDVTLEIENDPHFVICASNSVNEEVCFGLNKTSWYLDRSKSGNTGFHSQYATTLHATAEREFTDKQTSIKLFLDASSMEVFADGGVTTMTALHYPSQPLDKVYMKYLSPANDKSSVKIKNFKVWGLQCWFTEPAPKSGARISNSANVGLALIFTLALASIF
nr:putative GH32 family protein [Sinella curviseta]